MSLVRLVRALVRFLVRLVRFLVRASCGASGPIRLQTPSGQLMPCALPCA